eukprot:6190263-Pleurochrysis_carterae.AAC.5
MARFVHYLESGTVTTPAAVRMLRGDHNLLWTHAGAPTEWLMGSHNPASHNRSGNTRRAGTKRRGNACAATRHSCRGMQRLFISGRPAHGAGMRQIPADLFRHVAGAKVQHCPRLLVSRIF